MHRLLFSPWLFLLVWFGGPADLPAQSPYRFSWAGEAAWLGGTAVGLGVTIPLGKRSRALTEEQIAALDRERIPGFDRFASRKARARAVHNSDVLLYGSMGLPLTLLADRELREDAAGAGLLTAEAFLLNTALTQITKELILRPRPLAYNADVPLEIKLERDARLSFFSGHTSTAAVLSFATAKLWTDYHPDSDLKPVVWATAALIPVTMGYLRVRGGKHFPSDVLVGLVVGAATGILVPQLHR
jgi:membrane-associated phospholipid phosphatase